MLLEFKSGLTYFYCEIEYALFQKEGKQPCVERSAGAEENISR